MTDTTEYLTTVADWFVMKGGEVVYDINADDPTDADDDDCERPNWAMPVIHEVRIDDLQIFVGETVESFKVDGVVDVAVLLRTGIPLPETVVEEGVRGLRAVVPDFVSVDVVDEGSGVAVWLVTELGATNIDSGEFPATIEALIRVARSDEAREISR